MFLPPGQPARLPFAVSLAAYAVGALLAGIVTAYGAYRVGAAVLARAPHAAPPVTRSPAATRTLPQQTTAASAGAAEPRRQTVVRHASMTPSQDRWRRSDGAWPSYRQAVPPPPFGTSSRYGGRPSDDARHPFAARRDWDDDDDRMAYGGGYRTLCVRLCDGFYFPISFATGEERFEHDALACERSCGGQARLFVYRNPGGDIGDMEDLRGRPYRRLPTAFLYRTQYVPACKCQPHPWEAAAQDRHRLYALAAARSKGNRQAVRELEELHQKARIAQQAGVGKAPAVPAPVLLQSGTTAVPAATQPVPDPRLAAGEGQRMGLGADAQPKSTRPAPAFERRYERDFDWRRRAFQLF